MKRKLLIFAALGTMAFSMLGLVAQQTKEEHFAPAIAYANHDADTYYSGISDSLEGNDLLKALQSLNNSKRERQVGYGSMGTSAGGQFKYTDYDPNTVKYDSNGQPYGTAVLSFYSGNSTTSFNREHVWPNTHGGNKVENDIHMPRPTIPAENGSRSHSFYVEGVLTKNGGGWDPAMESFGKEDYRGDSARIIFYCMVASNQLVLTDDASRSSNTSNNEMGVISDMLSWNLRYPVLEREMNRNEGAEYLQGNRNPFIDHPEYACRIWGKFNEKTQQICSSVMPVTTKTITIKENGKVVSNSTINANESKTFEAYVDGEANSSVSWSLLKNNKTDAYTGDTSISITDGKATITAGDKSEILYLKASYTYDDDGTSRTVTSLVKLIVKGSVPSYDGETVKYTVSSTSSVSVEGEVPEGSSASYSQSYSTSQQITGGKNAVLTLSGYEGTCVTGITLKMHSNGKAGAGSFKAEVGSTTIASTSGEFNKWYGNDSYGTDWRDINVELLDSSCVVGAGETITLTIVGTTNSLYINSYTLTFNQGGDNPPPTPPDPPLPNDLLMDMYVDLEQTKTSYKVGDSFEKPYVVLVYDSGKTEQASDEYLTYSGFDSTKPGRLTIEVLYDDGIELEIAEYDIVVENKDNPPVQPDKVFESIEVDLNQTKTNYKYGEDFVKPYVNVKYSNGDVEKADAANITCSGFNSSNSGRQTITVTYKNGEDEGTTTYVVTVAEKPNDNPGGDTPSSSNGCGGNIATASIILSSLALAGIILVIITKVTRKKKSN